jgi:hypothetical protein
VKVLLISDQESSDVFGWPQQITVEGTRDQIEKFIDHFENGVYDYSLELADPTYDCGAQYCDEPECGTHGINYKLWREL